jgi:hypothetical protein
VIPVEVVHRDSESFGRLVDRQQFVGALYGCLRAQPHHRSTADFLQIPEKPWEFPYREFSRGCQDGLKFIPHGSGHLLRDPFQILRACADNWTITVRPLRATLFTRPALGCVDVSE